MGLCLDAAAKLTVVDQKGGRISNLSPSTEKVIEP